MGGWSAKEGGRGRTKTRVSSRFRQFEVSSKRTRRRLRSGGEWAHLSSWKLSVGRNVEDVLNKLRDGLSSDPEEDVLSVLDDEESVSFQSLAREVHGFGKDDSVLADGTSLEKKRKRRRGERDASVGDGEEESNGRELTSSGMV